MTNQRGEGEGEGAGSGSGSGRGQSEDPEPDEDQSQPEGRIDARRHNHTVRTPDSRTAEASSWPTGDLETDNQINVKIFLRKQARLELHRKVGFTGTTIRDENLRKQVDRLMHTQLNDTSSPNINYGHRRWPVEMRGGVDDFIRDLMLDIWLNEFDWRTDPLHAERCRTLVNEFQRTGLPQTIHYDLNDELELRHGSEEARNQAYRCPCWEEALGEGWFNHSDATLIETIGPGWGMENQHLLLHLLTRVRILKRQYGSEVCSGKVLWNC
ncbi:hypothetical protein R1sor_016047 [Riccia sorocarpa]|uniref:Uncharacterized protein n=1 Tax=Riccia sorocarpa TaxID=122646 RepID=A0ABD3HEA9_9MARC